MRISPIVALLCLLAPGIALAQASPEWLDRMAGERNAAKAESTGPFIPLPRLPPQRIARLTEPLVCRSAARPYLPIRRDPSLASPVVGYTQPQVAQATGEPNGFVRIKLYNGQGYGYLPRDQVRPYFSPDHPAQTCAVAGTRPGTGGLLFSYGE